MFSKSLVMMIRAKTNVDTDDGRRRWRRRRRNAEYGRHAKDDAANGYGWNDARDGRRAEIARPNPLLILFQMA